MSTAKQTPGSPAELPALFAQAIAEHQAGRLVEAAAAYEKVLALRPDVAEAHNNLGMILCHQGKFDAAAARFEQALAVRPNFADAHNNLGNLLRQQGRPDQAALQYQQVIALRPDFFVAYNNLGNILHEQGRLDQAAQCFQQTIALRPDFAEVHNNLGNVLSQQGRLDEAAACLKQAIALRPDYPEAHYNLGITLWFQDQLDAARARFEQAIALRPDYAEAYNNLGSVLRDQLKLTEAKQVFQRLATLVPDSASAQLGLATCYLLEEDYERGWPAFEARLKMPPVPVRPQGIPLWTDQPLEGRSLLLVGEQGFGDTLHFARFARQFKRRGARVVLAAQGSLGKLLAGHADWDEIFLLGSQAELPRTDFYLPLMSAPAALGTTAATIPHEVPYLAADPVLTSQWRDELAKIDGFKIGIVWQGSRDYLLDRWRSIPLAQFAPLAAVPGVKLISLQTGEGAQQIGAVDFPVLDLSDRLDRQAGPFMDTAAVIRNLDLVIAPDSGIAHLAGALGAPVWAALHYSTNWRWLLDRDDSPWYPTMRLFRQRTFGQWPDVFQRIAAAVTARLEKTA